MRYPRERGWGRGGGGGGLTDIGERDKQLSTYDLAYKCVCEKERERVRESVCV